ncbi:TIGR01777 family oxidoreductase [Bacillus sp. AFS029533]|uniref:TIGR01777 family oxidoreductase n=1 Tax=Bacillus sp. AFS029533 TaxID=2033494 RepID=UPI000BFC7179|nr:TIGR01777 family oxidoreductase [Bacillus sp. AFS029533]PGZ88172.1 TIGR01777 family protein [Bacillus sp. AFS029533]
MKILLTGGTGFIGSQLINEFIRHEFQCYIVTRNIRTSSNPFITYINWDQLTSNSFGESIDVVINLAGESINSGRWTKQLKDKILQSRIKSTNILITWFERQAHRPNLFINASAIGFYGTSGSITFNEHDKPISNDFLASTVREWETVARKAEDLGIRTILARFGLVLGLNGGALPKMILPYKLFMGGPIGKGTQWISWIHEKDVVGLILHSIKNTEIRGPINLVSPNPVTMNEFSRALSAALHRPNKLKVPNFALQLLLGEMSMLVLEGQKVIPSKAIQTNYNFQFPSLKEALLLTLN